MQQEPFGWSRGPAWRNKDISGPPEPDVASGGTSQGFPLTSPGPPPCDGLNLVPEGLRRVCPSQGQADAGGDALGDVPFAHVTAGHLGDKHGSTDGPSTNRANALTANTAARNRNLLHRPPPAARTTTPSGICSCKRGNYTRPSDQLLFCCPGSTRRNLQNAGGSAKSKEKSGWVPALSSQVWKILLIYMD